MYNPSTQDRHAAAISSSGWERCRWPDCCLLFSGELLKPRRGDRVHLERRLHVVAAAKPKASRLPGRPPHKLSDWHSSAPWTERTLDSTRHRPQHEVRAAAVSQSSGPRAPHDHSSVEKSAQNWSGHDVAGPSAARHDELHRLRRGRLAPCDRRRRARPAERHGGSPAATGSSLRVHTHYEYII